jgi:CrcB protein
MGGEGLDRCGHSSDRGGYTTFSTFSFETLELLQDGKPWGAVGYAFGSVAAGILGVWMAVKLAGK